MKLPEDRFSKIKDYIRRKPKINFKHVMVRATLLKNGIILREYDFLLRRSLDRRLAKDKKVHSQTSYLLKTYIENKFNTNKFTEERIKTQDKSFLDKIKGIFRKL